MGIVGCRSGGSVPSGDIPASAKRLIYGAASIVIVVAVAVVLASTVTSVSIPLSSERVSAYLRKHHLSYEAEFHKVRAAWNVRDNNFELHFEEIALFDLSGDRVASFPGVTVFPALPGLVAGDAATVAVAIARPEIRIVRTAGGALKIDIGETTNGSAGSLVTDFLTDLAAFSGRAASQDRPPRLLIEDARLELGDEITGAQFRFETADIDLRSDAEGVRGTLELEAEMFGEKLRIGLEGLFLSSDHSYLIDARFSNLNPAILADLLPNLSLLAPIEIALTGRIEARLDRHLVPRSAHVAAHGREGSLELVPFFGRNIKLNDLEIDGDFAVDDGRTIFDRWRVAWPGAALLGSAVLERKDRNAAEIQLDLTLLDQAWSAIAPRWFSPLVHDAAEVGEEPATYADLRQRLIVTALHEAGGAIRGRGALLSQDPRAGHGPDSAEPQRLPRFRAFGLEIDGTALSPRVKFAQLAEANDLPRSQADLCKRLRGFVTHRLRDDPAPLAETFPGLSGCLPSKDLRRPARE